MSNDLDIAFRSGDTEKLKDLFSKTCESIKKERDVIAEEDKELYMEKTRTAVFGEQEGDESTEEPSIDDFIELFVKMNLGKVELNKESFDSGVSSCSELAGKIAALTSVGISPETALDYIASSDIADKTYNLQIKTTEMNNKTSVECAKLTGEMNARGIA